MSRPLISCAAVASWLVGCAPPSEPAQVPAAVPVVLPDAPPPPEHGLPAAPLGETWAPPRTIAGDLDALRDALADATTVTAVVTPRMLSPGREGPVRGSLEQLAPAARWTLDTGLWSDVVVGSLPLDRVGEGAPRYPSTGITRVSTAKDTTVVIGDAPLDLRQWRAMPAASAGSCQPIYDGLALAQEQSLAYTEPFLDHADMVLRLRFRAGLAEVLPQLQSQVEPFASSEPPAAASPDEVEAHACGHALHTRVQEAARCLHTQTCPLAPRLVLRGGVAVAMPAAPWQPDDCTESVDVENTIVQVATEAAVATVSALEPRWVTLADRVGAMGTVYEAVEDLCSPRRRRFAKEDLEDARVRLERVERALGSEALDESGRWDIGVGSVFVPGLGPMVTLATFVHAESGAAQTAIVEAKGVRRFLLSRSLCRSGYGELPLAVAVFEPGQREATFFGYLYEEALVCADLPLPLSASAPASEPKPDIEPSPLAPRAPR